MSLNELQLAWCREYIASFAPAEADVKRRDASVAANRAAMGKGNCSETSAKDSALSHRLPLRLRLAAKTAPDNRGERA